MSICPYCALLAPQWKPNLRSTSVQVMNTWPLGYSITRLESQNRKFAPILIITGPKNDIFLYANKLGLSIRDSEILKNDSDSSLESLIMTRVESFCEQRDSSHWLDSRYHCHKVTIVFSLFFANCANATTRNSLSFYTTKLCTINWSLNRLSSAKLVQYNDVSRSAIWCQGQWHIEKIFTTIMWKHSRFSSRELTQPKHRSIRQLVGPSMN